MDGQDCGAGGAVHLAKAINTEIRDIMQLNAVGAGNGSEREIFIVKDEKVRRAALEILRGQSSLSEEILEEVVARLEHQDWNVGEAALEVLRGQSSLPDEILLKPRCIQSLYKSWLQRSFDEQVNGYIVDCCFSLNTPEGVKSFSFMSEDGLIRFKGMIKEVQSSLRIPKK
jgi:hypothetical protein